MFYVVFSYISSTLLLISHILKTLLYLSFVCGLWGYIVPYGGVYGYRGVGVGGDQIPCTGCSQFIAGCLVLSAVKLTPLL